MKFTLGSFALWVSLSGCVAQGTVNFINGATTLVSSGLAGQELPISDPRGAYYFGLLIAPPGTYEIGRFTFADLYATNIGPTFPGRLVGGLGVRVGGWAPGTLMSFAVAGWSASLGHDWNPSWLSGEFTATGYFGLSGVATGQSGDPAPTPLPALNLFGGERGIQTGFNLVPVPEPSVMALTAAAALLLRCGRSSTFRTPQKSASQDESGNFRR